MPNLKTRLLFAVLMMANGPLNAEPLPRWSVATNWTEGWPSDWVHAEATRTETSGQWTIHHGELRLPGGPDSNVFLGQNWATLNNTPFRKWKHYIYEGGSATPLIAHWPAGIPAARPAQPRAGALDRSHAHRVGTCRRQVPGHLQRP